MPGRAPAPRPAAAWGQRPRRARRAAGSPSPSALALSGRDVVVEPEDVFRVVAPLDFAEPVVVRPVCRADGILGLIVAEVVEPAAGAGVRSQRRERLAAPGDVRL